MSVGDISSKINSIDQLKAHCIIHCAGEAYNMKENKNFDTFHLVNTEGTRNLQNKQ